MTVVIGTAGHIDHGKTSLLRALTGIDADRLPEERERGMTIDVGYAHLDLPDGSSLDFVDVPGHDRLVGNMLVGAGEIDAALLVVAADDGPRAQTLEHLELLDALGIADGLAVVTKVDAVDAERASSVVAETAALLARTSLAGAPVLQASATTGLRIAELRDELVRLRDRVAVRSLARVGGPLRLSIDRAFGVRGRGAVVTGTLRGGAVAIGDRLRLEPGGVALRVRELQVHGAVKAAHDAGRTALNLAGTEAGALRRGQVVTAGPGVVASDRIQVVVRPVTTLGEGRGGAAWPPPDGARLRLHLGTEQVDATVTWRGRDGPTLPDGAATALLRLAAPVATFIGDRGILRQPSPGDAVAGVLVLDTRPPRGVSRRRITSDSLGALAAGIHDGDPDAAADALVRLHGALAAGSVEAVAGALRGPGQSAKAGGATSNATPSGGLVLAEDVVSSLEARATELVQGRHRSDPLSAGLPLADLRGALLVALRRLVSIDRSHLVDANAAVGRLIDDLVTRGRLARDGDRVRDPARVGGAPPELEAAMDRLEVALQVVAPPGLAEAARAAGCPPEGIHALLAAGRITRLEPDLAWATPTYHRLAALALDLARRGPLTPAAMRDATGTSRRYVLAILEDLGRRAILERTSEGHVPGPRAPATARG
jgi:selenocysteine-specific elongation factor